MVSSESVERACSEVDQYTDEQLAAEFDRFFRAQAPLCEFIVEMTHESGQKIQELCLFLSYMTFKALEISGPDSPKTVQPETVEAAYHETESWMTRLSLAGDGELQSSVVGSLQRDSEPFLLQYVIAELNDPTEDDDEDFSDEERGEVFFVLKTVITSLCSQPSQTLRPDA